MSIRTPLTLARLQAAIPIDTPFSVLTLRAQVETNGCEVSARTISDRVKTLLKEKIIREVTVAGDNSSTRYYVCDVGNSSKLQKKEVYVLNTPVIRFDGSNLSTNVFKLLHQRLIPCVSKQ